MLYLVPVYTSSCGFFLEPTSNKLSCEQEPTCHHAICKNSIGSLNFKEAQLLRPYAFFCLPRLKSHATARLCAWSACSAKVSARRVSRRSFRRRTSACNASLRDQTGKHRTVSGPWWTYARTAMKHNETRTMIVRIVAHRTSASAALRSLRHWKPCSLPFTLLQTLDSTP